MLDKPGPVPRDEPPPAAGGGTIAKADRVERGCFADRTAATNALTSGEADYFESAVNDPMPPPETAEGVPGETGDPLIRGETATGLVGRLILLCHKEYNPLIIKQRCRLHDNVALYINQGLMFSLTQQY